MAPRDVQRDFLRAHSRTGLASARRPQSARMASESDKKIEVSGNCSYGSDNHFQFKFIFIFV